MKNCKILFSLLVALFVIPSVVSASTERTTQLDLTHMDLTTNQEDSSEGWKWDAANSTLTLTNINFNVNGQKAIVVPSDKDLTINLVGDNKISSNKATISRISSANNTGTVTINGDGSLELIETGDEPVIDLVNLTIASGRIKAIDGSIAALQKIIITGGEVNIDTTNASPNGYTDGFYNASVFISNGKVDINASGAGIYVPGIGSENIPTGVSITGGEININSSIAAIYTGYKDDYNDIAKDVIIDGSTIDFKDSNLGIYSYKGTITITKKTNIMAKKGARIYGFHPDNDVRKLTIDSADYTNVDNKLASIPSDLSKYTDDSVAALNSVKSSISRDKNFLEQSIVDEYVVSLEEAIRNLKIKTFNVTTNVDKNASISLSNSTNIEYGSSRELSIVTDKGYKVKSIKVNGVDRISDLVNGKLSLSNITANLEIAIETEPEKYEFVSGKTATYEDKELTFKLNGLYSLFDKLYINDVELSKDNYTVVEGSTIITLKNEYLKTLSANTYKIKATYKNGSSDETIFTIKEKTISNEQNPTVSSVENPNTGDNILLYVCLCFVSIIGLASTSLYIKKKLN